MNRLLPLTLLALSSLLILCCNRYTEIGDRGTVGIKGWARQDGMKLPQPSTKKPPVIGVLEEVYWESRW